MSTKLFVGNLPYTMTSEDLKETFGPFGPVVSAKVITDRETGRSRGFGFVTMSTAEEAQNAIAALHGRDLDGRSLTVNVAKPREERSGGGGGGRRSRRRRGGVGRHEDGIEARNGAGTFRCHAPVASRTVRSNAEFATRQRRHGEAPPPVPPRATGD